MMKNQGTNKVVLSIPNFFAAVEVLNKILPYTGIEEDGKTKVNLYFSNLVICPSQWQPVGKIAKLSRRRQKMFLPLVFRKKITVKVLLTREYVDSSCTPYGECKIKDNSEPIKLLGFSIDEFFSTYSRTSDESSTLLSVLRSES